jgi:hypothetical protein
MTDQSRTLKQKAVHEARSLAIIFVYVWIIIGLFTFYKSIVLGVSIFDGQGFAVFKAFVLAKFILTLEMFKVGHLFPTRPPIYRILFKAVLYGVILMGLNVLEEGVRGWLHGHPFAQSIEEIGNGRLDGMIVLALIMGVSLTPFFACKEAMRVLGEHKLKAAIFSVPS